MGFKLSWVAIRGLDRAELLERLGAEDTGRPGQPGTARLALAEQGGWLIVVANECEFPRPLDLPRLSIGAELVGCWVEETVMASESCEWRDGAQVWAVRYDCDRDRQDVRTEGAVPEDLPALLETARREEAAQEEMRVDYTFDVPGQVATSVCGYHTPGRSEPEPEFTVLSLDGKTTDDHEPVWQMPPFLRRLFGKA